MAQAAPAAQASPATASRVLSVKALTDQQFMSYVALGRAVGRQAVQRLDTPTAIADLQRSTPPPQQADRSVGGVDRGRHAEGRDRTGQGA
jgi:hypothetical protein